MKRAACLVLLSLAQFTASAESLWRNIPAGSTPAEVRKTLPAVRTPSEPSVLADGKTEALLEYVGFQLGEIDFKATLYFKDGRLDRVFLNPVDRPVGQEARVAAYKLRDSLKAKYGVPTRDEEPRPTLGTADDAEWVQDGVVIKYSFTQYGDDGPGFLQVLYISPQDTSNL